MFCLVVIWVLTLIALDSRTAQLTYSAGILLVLALLFYSYHKVRPIVQINEDTVHFRGYNQSKTFDRKAVVGVRLKHHRMLSVLGLHRILVSSTAGQCKFWVPDFDRPSFERLIIML